jgi:hypothetical protein
MGESLHCNRGYQEFLSEIFLDFSIGCVIHNYCEIGEIERDTIPMKRKKETIPTKSIPHRVGRAKMSAEKPRAVQNGGIG